jgi:hypothetical protein
MTVDRTIRARACRALRDAVAPPASVPAFAGAPRRSSASVLRVMAQATATALVSGLLLGACASRDGADRRPETRTVRSNDGSYDGEMVGVPATGSRFGKLAIGMTYDEVVALIGLGNDVRPYATGKIFIPLYGGNDGQRLDVKYPGEGCLTFTDGTEAIAIGLRMAVTRPTRHQQLLRIAVDADLHYCWP